MCNAFKIRDVGVKEMQCGRRNCVCVCVSVPINVAAAEADMALPGSAYAMAPIWMYTLVFIHINLHIFYSLRPRGWNYFNQWWVFSQLYLGCVQSHACVKTYSGKRTSMPFKTIINLWKVCVMDEKTVVSWSHHCGQRDSIWASFIMWVGKSPPCFDLLLWWLFIVFVGSADNKGVLLPCVAACVCFIFHFLMWHYF